MLPDGWRWASLGDLAAQEDGALAVGPFGSRMKTSDYSDEGMAVVRGQNITDVGGLAGDFVFVPEAFARALGSAVLEPDDLVLPHRGSIGRAARIPTDGYVMSTSVMRIRLDRTRAEPRYVIAFLTSPAGRAEILKYGSTVGTPGIGQPLRSLSQMRVPLPPIDEQRRVAGVLGALDDLIDTNERLERGLLAWGVAAFRHGALAMDEERSIGSLSRSIARGVTPRYSDDVDSVVVVNQKCIRNANVNLGPARGMHPRSVPSHKVAESGDTLVNSTGVGTLGRVARWLGEQPIFVDSHVSVVKPDPATLPGSVLAYALVTNQSAVEALGHGSTGQTELSPARLGELTLLAPSGESAEALGASLDEIDWARWQLAIETESLRQTRDQLLPLLLSGRVSSGEVAV